MSRKTFQCQFLGLYRLLWCMTHLQQSIASKRRQWRTASAQKRCQIRRKRRYRARSMRAALKGFVPVDVGMLNNISHSIEGPDCRDGESLLVCKRAGANIYRGSMACELPFPFISFSARLQAPGLYDPDSLCHLCRRALSLRQPHRLLCWEAMLASPW